MVPGASDIFELAGLTLEGRYVIDEAVAEGGYGIVYRARHASLQRPIALKILKTPPQREGDAQGFLDAFATEAKTIARIAHPNIVQVYDFGVSLSAAGVRVPWIALEWLAGQTLADLLRARRGEGGQPPSACLAIMRPILDALAAVHAAGVAHRDLKPANIFVHESASGAVPKLLDFGIAKVMDAEARPETGQTRTSSARSPFSPAYASPEQLGGGRSGPWTDLHAVGLILSEMLTDRAPLDASDGVLLLQQLVAPRRPTPAAVGVCVGPWEAILRRTLAVSPSGRDPDAGTLLRALEASVDEADEAYHRARRASSPRAVPIGENDDTVDASLLPAPVAGSRAPSPREASSRATRLLLAAGAIAVAASALVATQRASARCEAPPAVAAQRADGTLVAPKSAPSMPVTSPTAARAMTSSAEPEAPRASRASWRTKKDGARAPAAVAPVAPPLAVSASPDVASLGPRCSPPYVIDAAGHRQFKHECL